MPLTFKKGDIVVFDNSQPLTGIFDSNYVDKCKEDIKHLEGEWIVLADCKAGQFWIPVGRTERGTNWAIKNDIAADYLRIIKRASYYYFNNLLRKEND